MRAHRQTVDLLYETPETRVRLDALLGALSFAFSSGDTGGFFERALERAEAGDSGFDAGCFAGDLFIDEFIERCMAVSVGRGRSQSSTAYVKRMLCHPPLSMSTTRLRQQILRELLDQPATRERLEAVYVEMLELRSLLSPTRSGNRYEVGQRRIDVLRSFKRVIDALVADFSDCQSELSRLSHFGSNVCQSLEYQRLAELLEYEEHLATVDLRVRVGSDGRLRNFELLGHRENLKNPLHQSWLARWWTKLTLLFRGYRLGEQEILTRLTDHVFDALKPAVAQLFQLLGDIEFYLAGLGLCDLAKRNQLDVCIPSFSSGVGGGDVDSHAMNANGANSAGMQLERVFNPFLVAAGVTVCPCDVALNQRQSMAVLTGPNSGGKTRLLQAIGLCQLLGQAGLAVPARSAELVWARGLFVSIVEEASAGQREGHLGSELLRVRRVFERITPGDLVVLDELCSGTNPSEGEEMFQLVIELLAELQPQLWLTTHFLQFAERLQQERAIPNLEFLQVELDADERPTFQFVPGVAKSSLARQTAARLGVTRHELELLVEEAKRRGVAGSNAGH